MLDLRQVLGANIRSLRGQLGLSQDDLAAGSGLSMNYIGYIERGKKWPSHEALSELAKALNTTPDRLLAEETEEDSQTTFALQTLWRRVEASLAAVAKDFHLDHKS